MARIFAEPGEDKLMEICDKNILISTATVNIKYAHRDGLFVNSNIILRRRTRTLWSAAAPRECKRSHWRRLTKETASRMNFKVGDAG
jgi:hypothetical protein